jgi:hypothetical protein
VSTNNHLKSILGKAFLLAFVFHALLSLYLTFFPKKGQLGNSWPAMFYEHFVHLGPFFVESRVKYYSRFNVAILEQNQWREIDVTQNEFDLFRKNIFAFRHLTIRDFLNHNARLFNASKRKMNSESFRKLHAFLKTEYFTDTEPDSIHWISKRIWFDPKDKTIREEIVFEYQYDPKDVE